MLLTISADDFGLHPEIDNGILELIDRKIVGATSILVNSPNFDITRALRAKDSKVSLGVHLAFTEMRPLCKDLGLEHPWCDRFGAFRSHWTELRKPLILNKLPKKLVEKEWNAQIHRFIELLGQPDFVDTHQNLHLIWPFSNVAQKVTLENHISKLRAFYDGLCIKQILPSLLSYSARKLVPLSLQLPTYGLFDSGRLSLDTIAKAITKARKIHKHIAIVAHPGSSVSLSKNYAHQPNYQLSWDKEYKILSSDEFLELLLKNSVKLARLDGSIL